MLLGRTRELAMSEVVVAPPTVRAIVPPNWSDGESMGAWRSSFARTTAPTCLRNAGQQQQLRIPAGIDWELLVVDNNCTDGTDAVLEEYRRLLPLRPLFNRSRARHTLAALSRRRPAIGSSGPTMTSCRSRVVGRVCRSNARRPEKQKGRSGRIHWTLAGNGSTPLDSPPSAADAGPLRDSAIWAPIERVIACDEFPFGVNMANVTFCANIHSRHAGGRTESNLRECKVKTFVRSRRSEQPDMRAAG